jgi:hypothetical protein
MTMTSIRSFTCKDPLNTKMNPTSCLNRAPKMPESQQLFFGLRLLSRIFEEFQHSAIKTKIVQHFVADFFIK